MSRNKGVLDGLQVQLTADLGGAVDGAMIYRADVWSALTSPSDELVLTIAEKVEAIARRQYRTPMTDVVRAVLAEAAGDEW